MKRLLLILSLLFVPSLFGAGVYWSRLRRSPDSELARIDQLVGRRSVSALLDSLEARYPENAEVQFLQARQLGLAGDLQRAVEALDRAAALGCPKTKVRRQHWLLLANRDFRAAEPHLQDLLGDNLDDRDVRLALAVGYIGLDRLIMAERLVAPLIDANPLDGEALCLRGRIRLRKHQADLARDDLEKAGGLADGWYYDATAQILLGDCYRQLKMIDRAYEVYRQCGSRYPENLRALYGVGRCAHYLGRSDEALDAFQEIVRARPSDTASLLQMAYIYDQRNELDKVVQILRQVEALEPEEPQMLVQMAKTLRAMGEQAASTVYQSRYEEIKKQREEIDRQRSGRSAPSPNTAGEDK